jgi:hypothetical protein
VTAQPSASATAWPASAADAPPPLPPPPGTHASPGGAAAAAPAAVAAAHVDARVDDVCAAAPDYAPRALAALRARLRDALEGGGE